MINSHDNMVSKIVLNSRIKNFTQIKIFTKVYHNSFVEIKFFDTEFLDNLS